MHGRRSASTIMTMTFNHRQKQCPTVEVRRGNSLVVQWLGLRAFTAMGPGSIPGEGTKIPQAERLSQKKKKVRRVGISRG